MIVFRTEVSNYTLRSGPNGSGPHIRRVHFRRPDRYNFFREIRDLECAGEGEPLIWRWPSGGRVTSAPVMRIEVHVPNGNIRINPELEVSNNVMPDGFWETPDSRTAYAVDAPVIQQDIFDRYRRARERRRQQVNAEQQSAWSRLFRNIEPEDRQRFDALAGGTAPCEDECESCLQYMAERLAARGYRCPFDEWEMDLMEPPFMVNDETIARIQEHQAQVGEFYEPEPSPRIGFAPSPEPDPVRLDFPLAA